MTQAHYGDDAGRSKCPQGQLVVKVSQSRNAWKAALCWPIATIRSPWNDDTLSYTQEMLWTKNDSVEAIRKHCESKTFLPRRHQTAAPEATAVPFPVLSCAYHPQAPELSRESRPAVATVRPNQVQDRQVPQPTLWHRAGRGRQSKWSMDSGTGWATFESQLHGFLAWHTQQVTFAFLASVFPSD